MKKLKSMTAYARHEQVIENWRVVWELRSVNHRYLDAHYHLPETVRGFEQEMKAALVKRFSRGRVDINLGITEQKDVEQSRRVNQAVVQKWSEWQDDIHAIIPNAAPLAVLDLINEGGVLEGGHSKEMLDEEALITSFNTALEVLLKSREAEGARLQEVLGEKLGRIASITTALIDHMPAYEQAHQSNWHAKIKKIQTEALDELRLHQEVAILIAKSDVTEELDRLQSHISEFRAALQSGKPVGRRLDFLLQEFNREANTLGSKSIHKEITNASVEIKVLIDQLREQVQNIE